MFNKYPQEWQGQYRRRINYTRDAGHTKKKLTNLITQLGDQGEGLALRTSGDTHRNSHALQEEMQNGTAPLENGFLVSYTAKYIFTIWTRNPTPRYLSKLDENLCMHIFLEAFS